MAVRDIFQFWRIKAWCFEPSLADQCIYDPQCWPFLFASSKEPEHSSNSSLFKLWSVRDIVDAVKLPCVLYITEIKNLIEPLELYLIDLLLFSLTDGTYSYILDKKDIFCQGYWKLFNLLKQKDHSISVLMTKPVANQKSVWCASMQHGCHNSPLMHFRLH